MKLKLAFIVGFIVVCSTLHAQVNSIKQASSSRGSSSSEGRRSGGGGGSAAAIYFAADLFRLLGAWQVNTLQHRGEVPNVLSLEVYGQMAVQPSQYYVFNPRVRGNWGIFFTDFRMNYMIEDKIGGIADLRTDDWQIIGLNVVNTRQVTARISTGIMHEAFGEGSTFSESVVGLQIMNPEHRFGGMGEFRWTRDYLSNTNPRLEASIGLQRRLVDRGAFHVYATAGAMFQRYYNEINVWGLQGGLAIKLY